MVRMGLMGRVRVMVTVRGGPGLELVRVRVGATVKPS